MTTSDTQFQRRYLRGGAEIGWQRADEGFHSRTKKRLPDPLRSDMVHSIRQSGGMTMAETNQNYATPSSVRSVTSYPARRGFKQGPVDPSLDYVIGVEDSIDIHC